VCVRIPDTDTSVPGFGALTGYLLGTLHPKDGEQHEAFKARLVDVFLNGISKRSS
jgi:hypothetical protein